MQLIMPPVGFEPVTPVYVLPMYNTRQQVFKTHVHHDDHIYDKLLNILQSRTTKTVVEYSYCQQRDCQPLLPAVNFGPLQVWISSLGLLSFGWMMD